MFKRITALVVALCMLLFGGVTALAANKTALANTMAILLDGQAVRPQGYVIGGYTYFKLRDIAYLMQNKSCKFSVGYDAASRSISIKTQAAYTPDGSEMKSNASGNKSAVSSTMTVLVNGSKKSLDAYNIDGYTYYKLRDLGTALGFSVGFVDSSRQITITTQQQTEPEPEFDTDAHLDGKLTILLDPGHGGTDPGASSPDGQYNENHLNLEVALYLRDMLQAQGVTVYMTRTDTDTYPSLNDRADMIEKYRESLDFFLCIHHNSGGGTGAEVLVPSDSQDPSGYSKQMAKLILDEFEELGLCNRGQKDGSGMRVLRGASDSDVPGVLTEFCFLDTSDIAFVSTSEGRKAEAAALYRAILAFFQTHAY
ncbi:MAG: N-acetylmuramoyl-L-alanine amidase [Butyricicoccus sp.]|nr:N-acetylmuramoyl-L-alanine amidase [Butyricicoccus sp.]